MASEHALERRAAKLAERLRQRVDMMADMMRPDGRALFSERLNEQKALQFWQKHRFDDLGQTVLSTWTPDLILQLDQRLAQANEIAGLGGGDGLAV